MQIKRDMYPGAPTALDTVVRGDTVVWTLSCKYNVNGALTTKVLTGMTNYLAVLRDSLLNPLTAFSDTTTGSVIVVSNATTGILTVTLSGAWMLAYQPGLFTLNFTALDGSGNTVVLGKTDIKLLSETGGVS